jgi:hypothetical protein
MAFRPRSAGDVRRTLLAVSSALPAAPSGDIGLEERRCQHVVDQPHDEPMASESVSELLPGQELAADQLADRAWVSRVTRRAAAVSRIFSLWFMDAFMDTGFMSNSGKIRASTRRDGSLPRASTKRVHRLRELAGGARDDVAEHGRGHPPGNNDRMLDFSTAVTGGLFFAPSAAMLDELAGSAPADTYAATPVTAATHGGVKCGHLTDGREVCDARSLSPVRVMRRPGHGQEQVTSSAALGVRTDLQAFRNRSAGPTGPGSAATPTQLAIAGCVEGAGSDNGCWPGQTS